MKKILALLLCICFVFLAGCGSDSRNGNVTASRVESVETAFNLATKKPSSSEDASETAGKSFDIKLSFVGDCMLASFKNQTTKGSFNEYAEKTHLNTFSKRCNRYLLMTTLLQ